MQRAARAMPVIVVGYWEFRKRSGLLAARFGRCLRRVRRGPDCNPRCSCCDHLRVSRDSVFIVSSAGFLTD